MLFISNSVCFTFRVYLLYISQQLILEKFKDIVIFRQDELVRTAVMRLACNRKVPGSNTERCTDLVLSTSKTMTT